MLLLLLFLVSDPSPATSMALLVLTALLLLLLNSTTATRTTYIVRVQTDLKPTIFPDVDHWYTSTLTSISSSPPLATQVDVDPSPFLHAYRNVFHGFSAALTPTEACLLRSLPGVLAVLPDRPRRLHTTRSPLFLRLLSSNSHPNYLLTDSHFGSALIIAFLDTGIHPEHCSFRHAGLGPPPPHWKGACEAGPSFQSTSCNNKLVGARFFSAGFKASVANTTADILSPRDTEGHGTHTASTAAGRPSAHASMLGYAWGVASGIAPNARIAAYKVCWSSGCFDSDVLAAIDRAVEDGADVISLSVGAVSTLYHLDPIAIAAFGATEKGVFVSASAGNDGPGEMTVTNGAPWITTVGAGTIDRSFSSDVVLGDGTVITGASLYPGPQPSPEKDFPLVYGGNASTSRIGFRFSSPFCMTGSLDPEAVKGKVVLCERGVVPRVQKGLVVKEAGGAGMVIANQSPDGDGLIADAHLLPAVAVGKMAGYAIHDYIRRTTDPRVRFSFRGTQLGVEPAPVVASFSARGPSAQSLYVVKPDVIAPGVGILAAWPDGVGPTGLVSDDRKVEFNILSGSSMACPHVSGLAALLKGAHPEWSPAAIRSALMTTAYTVDNLGHAILDESSGNVITGWGLGSGHVDPERAVDPGLVYDLTAEDYVEFLCGSNYTARDIRTISRRPVNCSRGSRPWDLNYPSISVVLEQAGEGKLEVEVRRTATMVAERPAVYTASMRAPAGTTVTVEPARLVFGKKGERLGFVVRVSAERVVGLPPGNSRTEFGALTWVDGKRTVRSPIAVTWQQPY